MDLLEQFVVGSTIHKLSPYWKEFWISLKHKKNEMKMEDFIVRLQIQEHHRDHETKSKDSWHVGKANPTRTKNN